MSDHFRTGCLRCPEQKAEHQEDQRPSLVKLVTQRLSQHSPIPSLFKRLPEAGSAPATHLSLTGAGPPAGSGFD